MEIKGVKFQFRTCQPGSSSPKTSSYKQDWDNQRLERNKILCDTIWETGGEGGQQGKETFGERLGKVRLDEDRRTEGWSEATARAKSNILSSRFTRNPLARRFAHRRKSSRT